MNPCCALAAVASLVLLGIFITDRARPSPVLASPVLLASSGTGCALDDGATGYFVQDGDTCSELNKVQIEYLVGQREFAGQRYCCPEAECSTNILKGICYGCVGSGCPGVPTPTPPPTGPLTKPVVGTYIGSFPAGRQPPALSSLPAAINLVMLSFAKDVNGDGLFTPFASWIESGISYNTVSADREANPSRTYLVSLGGAKDYGGTFRIKAGMTVEQWVANAASSVSLIINSYAAQGAEMQFEGGTADPNFKAAMDQLLTALKAKGFVTAIGPFYGGNYGGTSRDYSALDPQNIDAVNTQLYAMNCNTATCMQQNTLGAISETPGGASKFVYGLCSGNRNPSPQVGLEYLKTVAATPGVLGMFSWDAEDDTVMTPPYCLENLGSQILAGGSPDVSSCAWR